MTKWRRSVASAIVTFRGQMGQKLPSHLLQSPVTNMAVEFEPLFHVRRNNWFTAK